MLEKGGLLILYNWCSYKKRRERLRKERSHGDTDLTANLDANHAAVSTSTSGSHGDPGLIPNLDSSHGPVSTST